MIKSFRVLIEDVGVTFYVRDASGLICFGQDISERLENLTCLYVFVKVSAGKDIGLVIYI